MMRGNVKGTSKMLPKLYQAGIHLFKLWNMFKVTIKTSELRHIRITSSSEDIRRP